jgi:microcystin-dependent protein
LTQPFIGEIRIFGFNFPPRGWATCDGQILPIAQNQALFSILGTTYGGNGQTTFALPDFRGRTSMHWGQSPVSGATYQLGQLAGTEAVTLSQTQIPTHVHIASAQNVPGTSAKPPAKLISQSASTSPAFAANANLTLVNPASLTVTGGSQPHNNLQPYLVLNFSIALTGIFPSRN